MFVDAMDSHIPEQEQASKTRERDVEEPEIDEAASKERRKANQESQIRDETESARKIHEIMERLQQNTFDARMIQDQREALDKDSDLKRLYESVIENGDQEALREKSALQVKELRDLFFGDIRVWQVKKKRERKQKLRLFEDFVRGLAPVRADKNDHDEFLSPDQTGNVSSFGAQDILVHAHEYVYASFDQIGHLMSQGPNQRRLDRTDIAPRTQIVMNDVANVMARVQHGEGFLKKYLTNVFDFENGQEILALYLASVFDTPDQALHTLRNTSGHPEAAQRWDKRDVLYYRDREYSPTSIKDAQAQTQREEQLTRTFVARMKAILEQTGIEPPLSLELRIRGSARQEH